MCVRVQCKYILYFSSLMKKQNQIYAGIKLFNGSTIVNVYNILNYFVFGIIN